MLFELLKNSLRAVVERYGVEPDDGEGDWPAVKVIVAEGRSDITIKISDEGGGIPRSGMPMVWTYMYTTASTPMLEDNYNKNDFKAPMAGGFVLSFRAGAFLFVFLWADARLRTNPQDSATACPSLAAMHAISEAISSLFRWRVTGRTRTCI